MSGARHAARTLLLSFVVACVKPPPPSVEPRPVRTAGVAAAPAPTVPSPAHADGGAGALVDPDLDPATVARVLKGHLAAVNACYERELAKHAGLAGRVVMHWTIDGTGGTRNVTAEQDTLRDDEVLRCIAGLVATWHFPSPRPPNTVDVSFPFVFQSSPGNTPTARTGDAR